VLIGQSLKDIRENKYFPNYSFLIPYLLDNSSSYISLEDKEQVIFNMKIKR
jgi:hypothetical protein